jgi:hypothetical protein
MTKENISTKPASPVIRRRSISAKVEKILFIKAGGRCEFNGCNKYLFRHYLTKSEGNFAEKAHIVGFSESGPRGEKTVRPENINDINNLMLLCSDCHKLIDDNPEKYRVSILREFKRQHEKRIFQVTGLGPDMATAIVQLKAKIGGQAVDIPDAQVIEAIDPHYPIETPGNIIDLTSIDGDSAAYYEVASQEILRSIDRIYLPGSDVDKARHISLFALAPIPLLVYLGHRLSNKIPVDLYQRHRKPENWAWKNKGKPVEYIFRCLQEGKGDFKKKVSLVLSLSGTIHLEDLPNKIREKGSVYEITLAKGRPNPYFLNLREDLDRFRIIYQQSLREIQYKHGNLTELNFFPAVPAPVAVLCGKEILPKVDPDLLVYDYDKSRGGYFLVLRIERSIKS